MSTVPAVGELLRKVTIERIGPNRWQLTRERKSTGETFYAEDLLEAFDFVLMAYRPDGTPRGPRASEPKPSSKRRPAARRSA